MDMLDAVKIGVSRAGTLGFWDGACIEEIEASLTSAARGIKGNPPVGLPEEGLIYSIR